ncbi:hydantoinase/oxoprolinase family protein [Rhodococcus sp. B50]|uniref:hydantoinase/oxoprolinase family protein n=1 Tax=Rhodococcus sp. B50 TaxID=2682847 RepID=UPI001BD24B0B|nr:hydantoinase/oxoprolinase family protein [Rhodococcus sp. B50]MBS9376011.1 Acetophenone carboxylase gamma subunit [Rhodococcus sp. B50]
MTRYQIGSDIGGTFTDVAVVDDQGRIWTDKADTTPRALGDGLLAALDNVAAQMHVGLEDLLGRTTRFVNGTTAVTNSIAELDGARVGLLTTRGFGDNLTIARSARNAHRDQHFQRNLPQLVPRERIVEVSERIDRKGVAVVPLAEAEARRAIESLVAQDVDSIAISLLWSFRNPAHEELIADIVEKEYPGIFLSVSHRLHPVIREYERTMTTVLNSFTCLRVAEYVSSIESRLAERGLTVPIAFMQGFGGTVSAREALDRPITLVDSGPAAGVIGSQALAKRLGIDNIVTGDMGGTSFDVSVLPGQRTSVTQRVMLRDQFLTALAKIDVLPIGAGGGSVAHLDARQMPQVGPASAGADPGPACYGRGGQRPTVTDAAAVLGLLNPDVFLSGRRSLDLDAARTALTADFGSRLGIDAEDSAIAIYRIVTANMSNAVRAVTVERGHDPREFALCSYGGALGIFACDIARASGISTVLVPREAAVFSAHGLLDCDDVRTRVRSLNSKAAASDEVRDALVVLEDEAAAALRDSGYTDRDIEFTWQLDLKFSGQQWDLTVNLVRNPQFGAAELQKVIDDFPHRYELEFGEGSAWIGSPVLVMAARVIARASAGRPTPLRVAAGRDNTVADARTGSREVRIPSRGQRIPVDVYNAELFAEGPGVVGPALLEQPLTTVFVPEGWTHQVDAFGNHLLTDATAGNHSVRTEEVAK